MIEVTDLKKIYLLGQVEVAALRGVSLEIMKGFPVFLFVTILLLFFLEGQSPLMVSFIPSLYYFGKTIRLE